MDIKVKKANEIEKKEMASKPVWGCGVSEFDWYYDSEETCLLIEGEVTVSYGEKKRFFRRGRYGRVSAGAILRVESCKTG